MNMIVCTCDHCGKVVENCNTLNINFRGNNWQREICNDCYKEVNTKTSEFCDSITVTNNDDNE